MCRAVGFHHKIDKKSILLRKAWSLEAEALTLELEPNPGNPSCPTYSAIHSRPYRGQRMATADQLIVFISRQCHDLLNLERDTAEIDGCTVPHKLWPKILGISTNSSVLVGVLGLEFRLILTQENDGENFYHSALTSAFATRRANWHNRMIFGYTRSVVGLATVILVVFPTRLSSGHRWFPFSTVYGWFEGQISAMTSHKQGAHVLYTMSRQEMKVIGNMECRVQNACQSQLPLRWWENSWNPKTSIASCALKLPQSPPSERPLQQTALVRLRIVLQWWE